MKKYVLITLFAIVPVLQANPMGSFIARMTTKYGIKPREYVMAAIIGGLLVDNGFLKLKKHIDAGGVECFAVNSEWKERIKKYKVDSINHESKTFDKTLRGKIINKINRFLNGC